MFNVKHISMPKSFYHCPRCGYKTIQRSDIKKHFQRIRDCVNNNNIVLTKEIKEEVLLSHVYHPPKEPSQIINNNQQINNFNMFNNIVNTMDVEERMGCFLDYKEIQLNDFENGLENTFANRLSRLETNAPKGQYLLGLDDLFKLINEVTSIKTDDIRTFNVLFDQVVKRFRFYKSKRWESFLEEIGSKELVSMIKSYYLDTYEQYLFKNLYPDPKNSTNMNRFNGQEYLEIYYKFLSAFELNPFVKGKSDYDIIERDLKENNEYYLTETYSELYAKIKGELKSNEKNYITKKVINIVKENTVENLRKLNKLIMSLLKEDEDFRKEVLKTRLIEGSKETTILSDKTVLS